MTRGDLPLGWWSSAAAVMLGLGLLSIASADDAKAGRVTAMAAVIWACPLDNWRLGQDDGCDPIDTGTAIKIHRRGVRPEYPHGPFALIEYTVGEKTKIQYVIDNTVTPLGEDDPTVEEILERAAGGQGETLEERVRKGQEMLKRMRNARGESEAGR